MEADVVTVVYHYEDGLWWFESPDVPELSGGGNTGQRGRGLRPRAARQAGRAARRRCTCGATERSYSCFA